MRPRPRWRTLRYRLDPDRLVFVEPDQDQDQHGATAGLGAEGAPPEGHRPARALAHRDLPGRPAPGRVERVARVRLADQPALLPDLGGAALGADAPARRSRHPRQSRQRQEEGRPRGDPPGQCADRFSDTRMRPNVSYGFMPLSPLAFPSFSPGFPQHVRTGDRNVSVPLPFRGIPPGIGRDGVAVKVEFEENTRAQAFWKHFKEPEGGVPGQKDHRRGASRWTSPLNSAGDRVGMYVGHSERLWLYIRAGERQPSTQRAARMCACFFRIREEMSDQLLGENLEKISADGSTITVQTDWTRDAAQWIKEQFERLNSVRLAISSEATRSSDEQATGRSSSSSEMSVAPMPTAH